MPCKSGELQEKIKHTGSLSLFSPCPNLSEFFISLATLEYIHPMTHSGAVKTWRYISLTFPPIVIVWYELPEYASRVHRATIFRVVHSLATKSDTLTHSSLRSTPLQQDR